MYSLLLCSFFIKCWDGMGWDGERGEIGGGRVGVGWTRLWRDMLLTFRITRGEGGGGWGGSRWRGDWGEGEEKVISTTPTLPFPPRFSSPFQEKKRVKGKRNRNDNKTPISPPPSLSPQISLKARYSSRLRIELGEGNSPGWGGGHIVYIVIFP